MNKLLSFIKPGPQLDPVRIAPGNESQPSVTLETQRNLISSRTDTEAPPTGRVVES